MRKVLRKYFVPHKHNNYHPHLFRNISVLTILGISLFLLGVSYGNYQFLHKTVLGANIATNVLIDLANENREANKLPLLHKNKKLDVAAGLKADDMVDRKYFAHFAPDGTSPWYFINQAGYVFSYAGENLAINFTDSKEVDDAWMNSPTHRANLLNSNFKDIGVATKQGFFNGGDTIFVVQMFGTTPLPDEDSGVLKNLQKPVPPVVDARVTKKDENVKVVRQNESTIVAVNDAVTASGSAKENKEVLGAETYSTWIDRFVFDSPFYIQYFYIIVVIIVAFGICLRIIIEYKRQHTRHLIISIVFLLITLAIATLNLNFINVF